MTPSTQPAHLEVSGLIRQALYLIWRLRGPYVLISLILVSLALLTGNEALGLRAPAAQDQDSLRLVVRLAVTFLALVLFQFVWFRLVLLGPKHWLAAAKGRSRAAVLGRLTTLTLALLAIIAAIQGLALLLARPFFGAQMSNLLVILATLFLTARFGLVLAAASSGEKLSLQQSWEMTRRDMWTLMAAPFAGTLLTLLLLILLRTGLQGAGLHGAPHELLLTVLLAPLSQLPAALVVTILAVAWRQLARR